MATKAELEKKIKSQETIRKTFKSKGNDKMVGIIDKKIKDFKAEIKALQPKAVKKKVVKPKKIVGTMTEAECNKLIAKWKKRAEKSKATTEKNIKSGRAEKDGSLKVDASLEDEAKTIKNKKEDGQSLTKTEQKEATINIDKIIGQCVEMIKTKRDAKQMIRELIKKLNEKLEDIALGRLSYEGK